MNIFIYKSFRVLILITRFDYEHIRYNAVVLIIKLCMIQNQNVVFQKHL